jgi:hypothetical protein
MIPITRRFLAVLSACGIATSVLAYIESFSGATIDNSLQWVILLGIGVFALAIPIYILECPSPTNRNFWWKRFARGMPSWVVPCVYLSVLVVIGHFVWYFVQGGFGVPAIKDGQYVLDNRGRILKVLTQAEYLRLQEALLRIVASLMISSYFMPMMYWWFPRSRQQTD